jgi:hypothetical protein
MNKIIKILIIALTFGACNTQESKLLDDVKLDNGVAWNANIETTNGMHSMQEVILAFRKQNIDSLSKTEKIEVYNTVNLELKKEFNLIIKSCSMKGEAHNQLHNYILPMLKMFEGIGSNDILIIENNFQALDYRLEFYQVYFK